ncbi:MAG TPA: class I SAM-dependent methyltransferase [Symbiobacteriaceae bacterium]|jgi:predicted O-methyltransferase YrrM
MTLLHLPNEDDLMKTPGWLTSEEGRRLAYLASQVPPSQAIVEIGSYAGLSTGFLAAGSLHGNQAPVFAVDVWKHGGGCPLEVFEHHLEALRLRSIVQPLPGLSQEVCRWWNKPIGLLFIDGAHDWGGVKADFESWTPHLGPGNWLAVHDYHPTYADVKRFMDISVVDSPDWEGFGVVGVSLLTARRVAPTGGSA